MYIALNTVDTSTLKIIMDQSIPPVPLSPLALPAQPSRLSCQGIPQDGRDIAALSRSGSGCAQSEIGITRLLLIKSTMKALEYLQEDV